MGGVFRPPLSLEAGYGPGFRVGSTHNQTHAKIVEIGSRDSLF